VPILRNYLICATPRSGSNLLCELLSSLGIAGRPEEHLWDPEGTALEPLSERWPKVLEAGTGPDGVFGLKLLWYQAERLEKELPAVLGAPKQSLAEVLDSALAHPRYFYLTRKDRLRQGISFVRAMQTKRWRSMDTVRGEEEFNRASIDDALEFLAREENNWEGFFRRQGIEPFPLTYEEIETDASGAVTRMLRHLGYRKRGLVRLPPSRHRRQADGATEDWVRRYYT
jgi:LPS sulfotransferase NodH